MSICIGNYMGMHWTIAGKDMANIRTNGAVLRAAGAVSSQIPQMQCTAGQCLHNRP